MKIPDYTNTAIAVLMLGVFSGGMAVGVELGARMNAKSMHHKSVPMQSDFFYNLEDGELIAYPKDGFVLAKRTLKMDSMVIHLEP